MTVNEILLFTDFTKPTWGRPLGAYRLATYLRDKGFGVQVLDLVTDFTNEEIKKYLDDNLNSNTKIVGISTTFLFDLDGASRNHLNFRLKNHSVFQLIVQYVRNFNSKIKVIVGGPSAKQLVYLNADLYYYGYAEKDLDQFLFDNNNLKIFTSLNKDFDFSNLQVEYHPNDHIDYQETLVLELTRGCRFRCKFCSFPLNGRKPNTYFKDKTALRQEMINNFERHGTKFYFFSDDTYNESVDKVIYLSEVFSSLPFKIEFAAYLRLDLIHRYPEMIKILKNSGLRAAFFGIESLNDRSAASIGKGLGQIKTLDILGRLKAEWGNEVHVTSAYIIGLPYDTSETVTDWFNLIKSDSYYSDVINVQPLFLGDNKDLAYRSVFDQDPSRYGYEVITRPDGSIYWKNKNWDFDECQNISKKLINEYDIAKSRKFLRQYGYINMRGYGLSHEECMSLNLKNKDHKKIVQDKVQKRISNYKSKKLNL